MIARRVLALITLAATAACFTSPPSLESGAARDPHGLAGRVHMRSGPIFSAELLAVTDTAWVLASNQRIGFARYADVAQAEFDEIGPTNFRAGRTPSAKLLEKARLYARFPYGIPDTAMAVLLAEAKQTTLVNFATP